MSDVDFYIKSVPEQRLERFISIHELIMRLYPDAIVDMSYKMPTYRKGAGWVALANQKNYISLYTCSESHIKPYLSKHPNQKSGKGCLNFRSHDEIHYDDLENVIRHAFEHTKA